MEDVPQILQDVVSSLEELNQELRSILSPTLGDIGSHQSPVVPRIEVWDTGRAWEHEYRLYLVEKRSVTDCPTRSWICSGSCTSGSTSKPGIIKI